MHYMEFILTSVADSVLLVHEQDLHSSLHPSIIDPKGNSDSLLKKLSAHKIFYQEWQEVAVLSPVDFVFLNKTA